MTLEQLEAIIENPNSSLEELENALEELKNYQ